MKLPEILLQLHLSHRQAESFHLIVMNRPQFKHGHGVNSATFIYAVLIHVVALALMVEFGRLTCILWRLHD